MAPPIQTQHKPNTNPETPNHHQRTSHSFASQQRMFNRGEAISFVDHVKSQFEDDPEKYERFLGIMRDLKENVIGPYKVLLRIAALFNGYPDLAMEFNAFLPIDYQLHFEGEGEESHILLSTPNDGSWTKGDATAVRHRR